MAIDIGSPAIDRAAGYNLAQTLVNKNNPANLTGKITEVKIYLRSPDANATGVKVATFYASGDNLTTRDYQLIGTVIAGSVQTFEVDIDVQIGDYIGISRNAGGVIEMDYPGYSGMWYLDGDNIPCTDLAFTPGTNGSIISLYGTGITESTVTAQAVSDIDETTATGNGNITNTGGINCTKRGVCWNTTGSPTIADSKSEELGSFGTGAFTSAMTGLIRGERYYVKAYAYNPIGYSYSAEVNFYTYPAVTTYAPTNIIRADPTTVTANGLIDLDVVEDITTRGFKYGLTEADTWNNSETGTYTEGAFSLTLTGLTADTTYFIRAYAVGAWGTKYGSYLEFKTAYPYGANKVEIKSEATASAADIALVGGKRSLTIENHLIQTQTIADIISAAYLADYKDQKTKLRVTKPTPAPYTIGDTIERLSAKLPYYAAVSALISYATAVDAVHYYNLAGRDMLIRKLNVSFSAGNYVSVLELEN